MAEKNIFLQSQNQVQKQVQKLSQKQIQAIHFLEMSSAELTEEILKEVKENPALEIVSYGKENQLYSKNISIDNAKHTDFQSMLEQKESHNQTLQQHLLEQLNMINLTEDEYNLCKSLIYNLDRNGFYGTMLNPKTLLDKSRPKQNELMLEKCIKLLQNMDPIGICCKDVEESLFIQAKILHANKLVLFLLDGHLEMLDPPVASKILKKLNDFKIEWHSKAFAPELSIDKLKLTESYVQDSLDFILRLNIHPACDFDYDTTLSDYNKSDVILVVSKVKGEVYEDDITTGKIAIPGNYHLQVKYASGELPKVKIIENLKMDKKYLLAAKEFISNLQFRESTIFMQGFEIVKAQKDFFIHKDAKLNFLTRRQIAQQLSIHESTVSRMTGKKSNKYIQCDWGNFPVSYFFSTGVQDVHGKKISSETIKELIKKEIAKNENLSDSQITQILNQREIQISRRTVAKYREQMGLRNSYLRKYKI